MKHVKLLSLSILAACITAATAVAEDQPPAVPDTPAAITELVSARTFQLNQGFVHHWRAERPSFSSGYLLVLKVDPALVFPRQGPEPVLFVGNQTAERVNFGHKSGHVVAIVPAVIDDPKHPDYIDLETAPIWFGTPQLPEQVDAQIIRQERALALQQGIKPVAKEQLASALRAGGKTTLTTSSKTSLYGQASALIREYSPQENELADLLKAQSGD